MFIWACVKGMRKAKNEQNFGRFTELQLRRCERELEAKRRRSDRCLY